MSTDTPLIPDGVYNIFNVKNPGFAVDLINGNPLGTVSGFTFDTSLPEQRWKVKNIDNDQITLESMAAPHSYASSHDLLPGAPLLGSRNETAWYVNDLGGKLYELETVGRKYHWVLPVSENYVTILLEDVKGSPSEDAQWKFNSLG